MDVKNIVVGAGIWGCVIAERIASQLDEDVLVIDRRKHGGGNCHSQIDEKTGIEWHVYGTHIFHTKNREVWEYINRFTAFNTYRHKVLTLHGGKMYPMPIGLETINSFYGMLLRPFEAEAFIRAEAAKEGIQTPANLEEKAISLIGRPLYEAFIKGYTEKQWNKPARELPADIITRLPVRANYTFDYFNDPWQGLPLEGYGKLFDNLLRHKRIALKLGLDYADIAPSLPAACRVFYSGAIDEFFDYRLGALEWRSLDFAWEAQPYEDYQGTAVVNQADADVPFTRTHEYRHLHPERRYSDKGTVVVREYPKNFSRGDERYYPVNTPANQKLLAEYQQLAKERVPHVVFGGRLGGYKYLDMDATVAQALQIAQTLKKNM
jgi:UDP-galactopyranose mutase